MSSKFELIMFIKKKIVSMYLLYFEMLIIMQLMKNLVLYLQKFKLFNKVNNLLSPLSIFIKITKKIENVKYLQIAQKESK